MKAIILAAGRGKRMGSLTDDVHKSLIEINEKPILGHLIENCRDAGIDEFLITLGYMGNKIKEHFQDGREYGVRISYLEDRLTGPYQSFLEASKRIDDDTFACFCADNIVQTENIWKMIANYNRYSADGLFLAERQNYPQFTANTDAYGRINSIGKDKDRPVIVLDAIVRKSLTEEMIKDIEYYDDSKGISDSMNYICKKNRIYCVNIPFININTPEDLISAREQLSK